MSEKDFQEWKSNLSVIERAMFALEELQFGFSPTLAIIEDTLRGKDAIEQYQKIRQGWDTEEILKGQAFGL